MKTLPEQARITASMIALGERIAYGRDVELLLQLAAIAEAQEDVITRLKYEVDAIPAIKAERDEYKTLAQGWVAENAPGGWIDDLRKKCAEYVSAADDMAMSHKVERDQLQKDLNAELSGNAKLREIIGAKGGETMFEFANRFIAERGALMSAADPHKVVRDTLTARLNVLEAAAKLALDALVAESRTTESNGTLVRILTAITSLRQAGVQ